MAQHFSVNVSTIDREFFTPRNHPSESFISRMVIDALSTVKSDQVQLVLNDEPLQSLNEVGDFALTHEGEAATWAEWALIIAQWVQEHGWENLNLLQETLPIHFLTLGKRGKWWEWNGVEFFIIHDEEWEGVFDPNTVSGCRVSLLMSLP